MVRNIITQIPSFGTWPCDEIPYIWRHGNISFPSDEFPRELATNKVSHFIQNQFKKLIKKYNLEYVVEKTCANSLRVGFVDRIFPGAKYIFIVRNGIDVVSSAIIRWGAGFELSYTLKKMKYIPIIDFPYHFVRYVNNRVYKALSGNNHLSTWGPVFENMPALMDQCSLEEICAFQWKECVIKSEIALKKINKSRIYFIKYEDFVSNPIDECKKLLKFLGVLDKSLLDKDNFNHITTDNIGKGYNELSNNQISKISPIIIGTLKKYGYI